MWFCQFSVIQSFTIFIINCMHMEEFNLDVWPEVSLQIYIYELAIGGKVLQKASIILVWWNPN